MPITVTVNESVVVARPPEVVWDYTQDFSRRAAWDSAIRDAQVVEGHVPPRVRVRGAGGLRATLQYRQFDRPRRTSLVMEEVWSPLVAGGGGSWSYEGVDGGTRWTQTNTVTLRDGVLARLFVPLIRRQFRSATRRAMARAKRQIESSTSSSSPPR